jgi:hypothetical protein
VLPRVTDAEYAFSFWGNKCVGYPGECAWGVTDVLYIDFDHINPETKVVRGDRGGGYRAGQPDNPDRWRGPAQVLRMIRQYGIEHTKTIIQPLCKFCHAAKTKAEKDYLTKARGNDVGVEPFQLKLFK